MTISFFPLSKDKLEIPANGFLDVEFLTPADKPYYLKTMFCNKQEIGIDLKDDANSHNQEPITSNFFLNENDIDVKMGFAPGTRLQVRLHNWTSAAVTGLSFSLIGYKIVEQ